MRSEQAGRSHRALRHRGATSDPQRHGKLLGCLSWGGHEVICILKGALLDWGRGAGGIGQGVVRLVQGPGFRSGVTAGILGAVEVEVEPG